MKALIPFIIAAMFLVFSGTDLAAQGCTPDPQFTSSGFFPSTLPNVCEGEPYDQTITVVIPMDTMINIPPFSGTGTIDSIVLNSVNDLPSGLSYTCNPASCAFPGGQTSCIRIFGTPDTSGVFGIDLDITGFGTFLGAPISLPAVLTDTILVEVFEELEASVSVIDATCGVNDGSATVTPTAGTSPYTFSWSNGVMSNTINGVAAGSYDVVVTDGNGCTKTFIANIPSTGGGATIDSAASTVGWTGCGDGAGGFIQPNVSGGVGMLAYSWSSGETTQDINTLNGGTYTLTITDGAGCISIQSFEIDAPDVLALSVGNQENVSCNGDEDGSASVMTSGGVGTYSYAWNTNPAQTTMSATGLGPGSYTVTVTDEASCEKTLDFVITEPDALEVMLTKTDEGNFNANDGTASASVSGGTPPYNYQWSNNATTADIADLAPGEYTVTVIDDNGCEETATVEIIAVPVSIDGSQDQFQSLLVYPNPAQGIFTVEFSLNQAVEAEIAVLDLQGRTIVTYSNGGSMNFKKVIEITEKGLYLLQVKTAEATATQKLLVY